MSTSKLLAFPGADDSYSIFWTEYRSELRMCTGDTCACIIQCLQTVTLGKADGPAYAPHLQQFLYTSHSKA